MSIVQSIPKQQFNNNINQYIQLYKDKKNELNRNIKNIYNLDCNIDIEVLLNNNTNNLFIPSHSTDIIAQNTINQLRNSNLNNTEYKTDDDIPDGLVMRMHEMLPISEHNKNNENNENNMNDEYNINGHDDEYEYE